jgi:hypothetical protein
MKTSYVIINSKCNLVLEARESIENIIPTTFIAWLQKDNHWNKYDWKREEGREGSDYVEYTCGDLTAKCQRINGGMSDGSYSVFNDNAYIFF